MPFGGEPSHDLAGVHARLDDLERDLALHGFLLLGHKHQAEAAFADLFLELVRPDHRAGLFGDGGVIDSSGRFGEFNGRLVQVARRFIIRLQQCFDSPPQFEVITAFAVEDCGTIGLFDGGQKNGLHALGIDWHG